MEATDSSCPHAIWKHSAGTRAYDDAATTSIRYVLIIFIICRSIFTKLLSITTVARWVPDKSVYVVFLFISKLFQHTPNNNQSSRPKEGSNINSRNSNTWAIYKQLTLNTCSLQLEYVSPHSSSASSLRVYWLSLQRSPGICPAFCDQTGCFLIV